MSQINFKEDHHKIKFKCIQCGHCCRNSRIRLSPLDIHKLCQKLNLSPEEFHQKYTYFVNDPENQNFPTCLLKTNPECVFLGADGCEIYDDRPLGCRTFPLAIQPLFDGKKFSARFYVLEECAGFGSGSKISISEFKERQGIVIGKEYKEWIKFVVKRINSNLPGFEIYYENLRN